MSRKQILNSQKNTQDSFDNFNIFLENKIQEVKY